jgi:predicted nuclease with TOPRIM domain
MPIINNDNLQLCDTIVRQALGMSLYDDQVIALRHENEVLRASLKDSSVAVENQRIESQTQMLELVNSLQAAERSNQQVLDDRDQLLAEVTELRNRVLALLPEPEVADQKMIAPLAAFLPGQQVSG